MTDFKAMILMRKYKSQGLGLLLTGIFGGLGLFYSSIAGGMIVGVIEFTVGYLLSKSYTNTAYLYGVNAANGVLGKFLITLLVIRLISLFISYRAIGSYNEDVDAEILQLSEPNEEKEKQKEIAIQLEEADNLVNNSDSGTSDTVWVLTGLSLAFILVIIGICYHNGGKNRELSATMEAVHASDLLNTENYIVKLDTTWVYYSPTTNDKSDLYYKKEDIMSAIKERNGFIYISANEAGTTDTFFGWVNKSDLENLGGCMH